MAGNFVEATSNGVQVVVPFRRLRLSGPSNPTQQGAPNDVVSDVFSFSVALFESLCGVRPYLLQDLIHAARRAQPANRETARG